MNIEENLKQELIKKFSYLDGKITVQRIRRIYVDVELTHFREVFEFAVLKMNFNLLCTITGLDEGATLSFIYHLSNEAGIMLNIKTSAPKDNPDIETVTNYFPQADAYERELVDLFGANVSGLVPGLRYPLTDDWPKDEHPLRKDWKPHDQ